MSEADLSLEDARGIALTAQGFDRCRPTRVDVRHLRRVVRTLGLIQLDFVNVLVPAHYQVPFSRLGGYPRSRLDDLAYHRRECTEQWAHEASILPMELWPLLRHRRATHRVRPWGFEKFLAENAAYVERVLGLVRERGPLSADELPVPDGVKRKIPDAWFTTVPRATLEALFGRGLLAVSARRANFARVYDLAERVIPREILELQYTRAEAERRLVALAARAQGIATAADLADYFRLKVADARPRIEELVEAGVLRQARVDGWREPAYLHADARRRTIRAAALLSPFDPVVWTRARAARLFAFEYRIEIYVPKPKRRWGYYVLPFLLGEELVARVDLRADRGARALRVPAAHLEPGRSARAVAEPLAAELRAVAEWLKLGDVIVGRRGGLSRALAAAVRVVH